MKGDTVVEVSDDDLRRYERIQPFFERANRFLYSTFPTKILASVVGILFVSTILLICSDDRNSKVPVLFYMAVCGFMVSGGVLLLAFLFGALLRLARLCFPSLQRVEAARYQNRGRWHRRRRRSGQHVSSRRHSKL